MMIKNYFKKRILTYLIPAFLIAISSVYSDEISFLQEQAAMYFQPIPGKPPQIENNPATLEKILLGRMLFFDPRLSSSQLISCNTCHNMGLSGTDLQENSIGHGWQKGRRNAPSIFNAVFNTTQFWDGRAKDLAEQAKGPIMESVEMNNSLNNLILTLKSIPAYMALFQNAFKYDNKPIKLDNITKAITVFEATLLTPNSRFDQFIKGNISALDSKEQEGLNLFMNRNCSSCHYGINIGGKDFYVFGRLLDPQQIEVRPSDDLGRYEITNIVHDKYVFRAASLRNVERTAPYFHSGKIWSLVQAVKTMGYAQLGYSPTTEDAEKIAAFLKTLTGEQPKIEYPELPAN